MGYNPIRKGGYLHSHIKAARTQTSGRGELSLGYNIVMPAGIKYVKGEIPISNIWGARRILKSLDLRFLDSTTHKWMHFASIWHIRNHSEGVIGDSNWLELTQLNSK